MFIISSFTKLHAQNAESKFNSPSWWFGGSIAVNGNFYQGSTQQLNGSLMAPTPFQEGMGLGGYLTPYIEYQNFDSRWGISLQAGFDSRNGTFNEVISPCNCPRGLKVNLNYATIEPSLRFRPFKSAFYIFGGPRISFVWNKSFVYRQENDPNNSDQTPIPDIESDFSEMRNVLYSSQIGVGYDFSISNPTNRTQFVVSPFLSFLPYWGHEPRSIETWNISTLRAGITLKFGRGSVINKSGEPIDLFRLNATLENSYRSGNFKVNSPENIATEHRVRETFPICNYIFFDLGSTEIPDRYILLDKSEVRGFKTNQLEVHIPKRLSGRSNRQLIVYYNILNIIGDRMGEYPNAKIQLIGSSLQGSSDGLLMAKSIRNYLHLVFNIDTMRIGIEGNTLPKLPSMQPYVKKEIYLHQEGDRRVSIESNSSEMLMEFQSGHDVPLKPVEMHNVQLAPLDSYMTFYNEGSNKVFSTWSMEIQDVKGETHLYGPYNKEKITIPGKFILGKKPQGNYKVTMIGQLRSGGIIKEDTSVHVVLWSPSVDEEAMRYSILFGFNNAKATELYKRYLLEIIAPKIPSGSKVIIHGYTDIIGDDDYNLKLSEERSNEVYQILKSEILRIGKTDVIFNVYGFGEDLGLLPFENDTPEERFYNRTVIVDIIPKD
jgi:outer membrane protein OmpA-like peptidoglycan-associated protein